MYIAHPYSNIQSLMQDDKIVSVAFASDIWSSSVSPMSMLSLTAQFIDEKLLTETTSVEIDMPDIAQ